MNLKSCAVEERCCGGGIPADPIFGMQWIEIHYFKDGGPKLTCQSQHALCGTHRDQIKSSHMPKNKGCILYGSWKKMFMTKWVFFL